MGIAKYFGDALRNLVANLGTERDKAASTFYVPPVLTDAQLVDGYRGAWLPRKIVDVPALDACRNWRNWQAEKDQITKIEAEETRLNVQGKVLEAMIKARLFGGAAVLIGTGDRDPSQPLTAESNKRIKYLTVLTRRVLTAKELERDPQSERFGKPTAYTISSGAGVVDIHPSRLVTFIGAQHPDEELQSGENHGWGDSVLLSALDAVKNADATAANVASLVFEAKIDVLKIPNFMNGLADPEYERLVLNRMQLAAAAKGINGALLLDKDEEYEQKQAQFGTLPDVIFAFLQMVSGAADIPLTRLLGQSPGGLQASGDNDIRNYYDRVKAMQKLQMQPAMTVLDALLVYGALGSRPAEIYYDWASLWQTTAKERAEIGKMSAETIKTLGDSGLIPEQALSEAAVNMLVENNVLPGLDAAVEQYGTELPEDPSGQEAGVVMKDAAPRTLYVRRNVLNAAEIISWAKDQGFKTTLAEKDLHVTIAFSRTEVDWMKVGEAWNNNSKGEMTVSPGGARLIDTLGPMKDATVLLFNSSELSWRHMAIREAGASWDWSEYQPHITITYDRGDVDLTKVEPYRGAIVLGPEIFEEVKESWKASIKEAA